MRHIYSLIGFLFLSGCASGPQAAECYSPAWELENYQAQVNAANPGLKWTDFTPEERTRALGVINNSPPVTGYVYNRIGYFSSDNHSVVLVVFMVDNCVWEAKMTPRNMLKFLLGNGQNT